MKTNYLWWGISSIAIVTVCLACVFLIERKGVELLNTNITKTETKTQTKEISVKTPNKNITNNDKEVVKKYDLYNNASYDIPLSSIAEISKLPLEVKQKVDKIIEDSQGIYMLKTGNDKVFIITQNSNGTENRFSRNNVEFIEISLNSGKNYEETIRTIGYTGENNEMENSINGIKTEQDYWEYDRNSDIPRPKKHIKYSNDGKVQFTENWNYDNSPIKYEMKNENDKVVSVLTETTENGENYTREQLYYSEDGHTEMRISAHYTGANLSRFTYYNAKSPNESISIMNEYANNSKTTEKIYNSDYELVNTVKADYEDDIRKNIKVYDKDGKVITDISS